jgi:hypothetical protein
MCASGGVPVDYLGPMEAKPQLRSIKQTGSGAAVAHLLWEQEVGGSNPPSPTHSQRTPMPDQNLARSDLVRRLPDASMHLFPFAVLGVGDVASPVGGTVGDGDVGHEVLVVGAVPVLLTVGCEVSVAGPELDDALTA